MESNPELIEARKLKAELYKKLLEVAGPEQVYWQRLKDYMFGKLSRAELDYYASFYFVDENADIYNRFLLTVVKCATLPLETPIKSRLNAAGETEKVEDLSNKKRSRSLNEGGEILDRQQLKAIIKQMSKEEREKLKNLTKAEPVKSAQEPFDITKFNDLKKLPEQDLLEYQQGVMVPLCIESKCLPSPEQLYLRLKAKVMKCGLTDVDERTSEYLLSALENHLQTLLAAVLEKTHHKKLKGSTGDLRRPILYKPKTILDLPTIHNPDLKRKGSNTNLDSRSNFASLSFFPRLPFPRHEGMSTISSRDLFTTFTMSPYLLVETPQAFQRLTTIHDHTYYPNASAQPDCHKVVMKRRSTSRGSIQVNSNQLPKQNLIVHNPSTIGTSNQDLFGRDEEPTTQVGLFGIRKDTVDNSVGLFGTNPLTNTADLFSLKPSTQHEFKSVLQNLSPNVTSIDF